MPPIAAMRCRATSEPKTVWTHASIAGHLQQELRIPISASQVGWILGELDVKSVAETAARRTRPTHRSGSTL